jgi:hypothetical protein
VPAALSADPRLSVHLEDLRDEALDRVRAFEGVDAELVPALVDLRRRLVQIDPASDDSDRAPPKLPTVDPSWSVSLAAFDQTAARAPKPLNYRGDGSRSDELASGENAPRSTSCLGTIIAAVQLPLVRLGAPL